MSASFKKYSKQRRQIKSLHPETRRSSVNIHQQPLTISQGAGPVNNYLEPPPIRLMVESPETSSTSRQTATQSSQNQLGSIRIVWLTEKETGCGACFIAKVDEEENNSSIYYESLSECFAGNILQRKVRRYPTDQSILVAGQYISSGAQFIELTVTGRETLMGTNELPVMQRLTVISRRPTDKSNFHLILGRDYLDAQNSGAQLGIVDPQHFVGHGIPSTASPGYSLPNYSTYTNPAYSEAAGLEEWVTNESSYQNPVFGNGEIGAVGTASYPLQDPYQ